MPVSILFFFLSLFISSGFSFYHFPVPWSRHCALAFQIIRSRRETFVIWLARHQTATAAIIICKAREKKKKKKKKKENHFMDGCALLGIAFYRGDDWMRPVNKSRNRESFFFFFFIIKARPALTFTRVFSTFFFHFYMFSWRKTCCCYCSCLHWMFVIVCVQICWFS